ncbi:MAG TPA: aspartate aminotransferase family protein [Cytophagaceae bacterium]
MYPKNFPCLPPQGLSPKELSARIQLERSNDLRWKEGKSFCLIYYPGDERAAIIKEAYNALFYENALNPMSFPSLRKFENEVVKIVANLLGGNAATVGTMTSGGTESILMAVKTARDYARVNKPEIRNPEIIVPMTAHPAFEKACHYFNVKPIYIPVDPVSFKADIHATRNAITPETIMLVGSAPSYPHGVMDPVENLSELASEHKLLLHVDACIGGMILPFIKMNGGRVRSFDFSLPGVTSISVDLHKYGYAAKGASVILYKNASLRKHQFFVSTEWPGGIYGSASVSGTRPGAVIAAAWAALMSIGEEGYCEMAKSTMATTEILIKGIREIPELCLMGESEMCIVAFTSNTINMYEVADELNSKGWHFERLQNPPGLHLTVNYIHTSAIASQFLNDLKDAVQKAGKFKLKNIGETIKVAAIKRLIKVLPQGTIAKIQSQFSGSSAVTATRTAPIYGMMGALNGSKDLDEIVLDLLDKLNRID